MKFILGYKQDSTRILYKGKLTPVTQVQAGPCFITQIRTQETDGYQALQLGFGVSKKVNKPREGHLKGLSNFRHLSEFRIPTKENISFERGKIIDVSVFAEGDKVKIAGISKGRGFQGVVKRHKFAGGKKSHGHKDQLRMPGSLGAGGVQKVPKGKRMAGHMGAQNRTVLNLTVIGVDSKNNLLTIKGALPGAKGGLVKIMHNDI